MPESIEEYAARLDAALPSDRRVPVSDVAYAEWHTFPFEAAELAVKPLDPLAEADAPREGDDPATCALCRPVAPPWRVAWSDDAWRVKVGPPTGVPVTLSLEPVAHHDLADLPAERAAELGRLSVVLAAAIEALPSVGRCHVSRWGDGAGHLHLWFIARPLRMPQLRGTFNALWEDILPPVPLEVRDDNVRFVAERVAAAYGGEVHD